MLPSSSIIYILYRMLLEKTQDDRLIINMKIKVLLLSLLLTSCTVYTEKQSEALSQNAYATDDSLNPKKSYEPHLTPRLGSLGNPV